MTRKPTSVYLRSRSPYARVRHVTVDGEGVYFQAKSAAGDWFPVSYAHPLGLAADLGVLKDALKIYDEQRTALRTQRSMGNDRE